MAINDRGQRVLLMTQKESAHLLNLLSDNAREWNADLRRQLGEYVDNTQAFNARIELQPRP